MANLETTIDLRPKSILDTDLCKYHVFQLTMQHAVLQHFPETNVTYRFTNWTKDKLFSRDCFNLARQSINRSTCQPIPQLDLDALSSGLSELQLKPEEVEWLRTNCPYFTEDYIQYLGSFRLRPEEQVKMEFHVISQANTGVEEGYITVDINGLWVETILYEVQIMAILSEAFFSTVDRDWTYDGQEEFAYQKAKKLIQGGASFSELGTRRRRSYHGQDLALQGFIRANKEFNGEAIRGKFTSTSNPHFAMKYKLTAMGLIAHEWIMGIAAIRGYESANGLALDLWEATYPTIKSNALHIALTDTFSTDVFNKNFEVNVERAKRWRGLRQDSGDPLAFIPKARALYERLGIDHRTKTIVFSDGLDVEATLKIQEAIDQEEFIGAFGIGTFFTNDYKRLDNSERSWPLVMVVKLASVEDVPCVKLGDNLSKNTGDPNILSQIKQRLGITV